MTGSRWRGGGSTATRIRRARGSRSLRSRSSVMSLCTSTRRLLRAGRPQVLDELGGYGHVRLAVDRPFAPDDINDFRPGQWRGRIGRKRVGQRPRHQIVDGRSDFPRQPGRTTCKAAISIGSSSYGRESMTTGSTPRFTAKAYFHSARRPRPSHSRATRPARRHPRRGSARGSGPTTCDRPSVAPRRSRRVAVPFHLRLQPEGGRVVVTGVRQKDVLRHGLLRFGSQVAARVEETFSGCGDT